MIAITAATGHLGRLVIAGLLEKVPASSLAAIVRNPAKAADLAARGVTIRQADYTDPAALARAFTGIEKALLISSSEIGRRAEHHRNAINAARQAGVKLLVYTSLLRADYTLLANLGPEHSATEQVIQDSGLPHIILRNGWYTENYAGSIAGAAAHGALIGCAGNGRISSAARADYAAAAVAALTGAAKTGRTYELAGDAAFTLSELAAEISRQTGKTIPYQNLTEADYCAALVKAGVPAPFAAAVASWDTATAGGALFSSNHDLSRLIGRPTTPLAETVAQTLKG